MCVSINCCNITATRSWLVWVVWLVLVWTWILYLTPFCPACAYSSGNYPPHRPGKIGNHLNRMCWIKIITHWGESRFSSMHFDRYIHFSKGAFIGIGMRDGCRGFYSISFTTIHSNTTPIMTFPYHIWENIIPRDCLSPPQPRINPFNAEYLQWTIPILDKTKAVCRGERLNIKGTDYFT